MNTFTILSFVELRTSIVQRSPRDVASGIVLGGTIGWMTGVPFLISQVKFELGTY